MDDADVLIIQTAIKKAVNNIIIVVGEDVDLLAILTARTPVSQDFFFQTRLRFQHSKNVERKLYSSRSLDLHHLIR